MRKIKVIKKDEQKKREAIDRKDYQTRMELSLLKVLVEKHPRDAKEYVRELPVAVL